MCPNQTAAVVTALAAALAEGKSAEELGLLAAIFNQLGDTLATIAAQQAFCGPQAGTALPPMQPAKGVNGNGEPFVPV